MTEQYKLFADLAAEIELPTDGTLSRTLYQDERLKVILFGFGPGQELFEHTAFSPAIMHFLSGEVEVTLDSDRISAHDGTWVHMPPQLLHSIRAKSAMVMLLILLKSSTK